MSVVSSDSARRAHAPDDSQAINLDRARRERPSTALAWIPLLALGVDALCVGLALFGAGLGRQYLDVFPQSTSELPPRLAIAAPYIAVGWILAIAVFGGYERRVFGASTEEYKRVLNASLVTGALIGIGCYLVRFQLSRGFFVLAVVLGTVLLLLGRLALRKTIKRARQSGSLLHRVLIVGSDSHIDEIVAVLHRESWLGYDVVGALTPAHSGATTTTAGVPVLGDPTSIVETAHEVSADVVFLAGGAVESASRMREIAWELESTDSHLVIAPSLTDVARERISVRPVGGLPLIHLEKPRSAAAAKRAKRTFDLVGSFLLLIAFSPVFLYAAFRIWSYDRGPILFKQERVGRDGIPFRCLKFRTMVTDAEARLLEVHAQQGSDRGVFVKIKSDPRVTGPGQWLRRFSLDELPQLVNVLRGDMSLVGPRPQVEHEVALYDSAMARRLHVRPGMTGLWQVSGRSDLSITEAIRLDLYYVDNWSMVQDLAILARTLGAVMATRGAY